MRWSSACVTAFVSLATTPEFSHGFAFQPQRVRCKDSFLSVSGMGWDNEDFLDGLGKDPESQDEANEKYYKHARMGRPEDAGNDDDIPEEGTAGAVLTKDMIEKAKASHDPQEEASGGGTRFQEMKKRAEEAAASGVKRPPPSMAAPPPPAAEVAENNPADLGNLTTEQQAALFRQMMANQQGVAPAPQQASPPQPVTAARQPFGNAVAPDGKRIGRNRDADAIVNSADVYFAQLKQDSNVRNSARVKGDESTANAVFEDPSLQEIELHVNPYLEEARKKEAAMIETSADEMFLPSMFKEDKDDKPKDYAGVSFKERLKAKRAGKSGEPDKPAAQAPPESSPQASQQAPPVAVPPSSSPEVPPSPPVDPTPMSVVQPTSPVQETSPVPSQLQDTQDAARPEAGSDEMRADVRTMMGLLMKHKGGPGFGVGRIVGRERELFESLARSVTATLRDEAMLYPDDLVGEGIDLQVEASPSSNMQLPPTPAVPTSHENGSTSSQSSTGNVDGMVACIEGAVLMYRNSPPNLQESVVMTLRAALLSAVNTCNQIVGDDAPSAQVPTPPQNSDLLPTIACVEGAIQMYKNSPEELKPTVLVTLRAALLSAVATCNAVVANNEVANVQSYQSTATEAQMQPEEKKEFYSVVPTGGDPTADSAADEVTAESPADLVEPVAQAEAAAKIIYEGDDPNTDFFVDVYERLRNAAGDGNLGLRKDLTSEEAGALADDIADARVLLVDELDNGIPKPENEEKASSTASKYQQLLAKMRKQED